MQAAGQNDSSIKNIVIIGAGGFGREVADTIRAINKVSREYNIIGFIDDDESLKGAVLNGIAVVGTGNELKRLAKEELLYAVIAIGAPKVKKVIAEKYNAYVRWETIIHPSAVISDYTKIGEGCIFQAHIFVGPNTKIGNHCMLNIGTSLGHDAVMGDYSSAMCQCDITGGVILEEGVYLGSGARIVPLKVIGSWAFLCAGSVVLDSIEAGAKVIGNPALVKWG